MLALGTFYLQFIKLDIVKYLLKQVRLLNIRKNKSYVLVNITR
jgi:hypothetical protein